MIKVEDIKVGLRFHRPGFGVCFITKIRRRALEFHFRSEDQLWSGIYETQIFLDQLKKGKITLVGYVAERKE